MDENEYQDCYEPTVEVPNGVMIVAIDLQDNEEEMAVNMVRMNNEEEDEKCLITLDSGADISVLPRSYANVGMRQDGRDELKMVDAQGRKIAHDGVTRARIRLMDKGGKRVEIVEEFVLGNVQHPILCAGSLLRKGWSLSNVDGSLHLLLTSH